MCSTTWWYLITLSLADRLLHHMLLDGLLLAARGNDVALGERRKTATERKSEMEIQAEEKDL